MFFIRFDGRVFFMFLIALLSDCVICTYSEMLCDNVVEEQIFVQVSVSTPHAASATSA